MHTQMRISACTNSSLCARFFYVGLGHKNDTKRRKCASTSLWILILPYLPTAARENSRSDVQKNLANLLLLGQPKSAALFTCGEPSAGRHFGCMLLLLVDICEIWRDITFAIYYKVIFCTKLGNICKAHRNYNLLKPGQAYRGLIIMN